MKKKNSRGAKGNGNIRKRSDGCWEGRCVVCNPATGEKIRRSFYGKTKDEVRRKITSAMAAVDSGNYKEPCKMTVEEWAESWMENYLGDVKPRSAESYEMIIRYHIQPALGAIKLEALNTDMIQRFYNRLEKGTNGEQGLSPKTIRNIHGVLHKVLNQAVTSGYLQKNPADGCKPPKVIRKDLCPLDEEETARFVKAIKGHPLEILFLVALFTGMRQGEILGLSWSRVDFKKGTIRIDKQLQRTTGSGSVYKLVTTKSSKGRTITPAPYIMDRLRDQRAKQAKWQLKAGANWDNTWNLVFTNEYGRHLMHHTVYHRFKDIAVQIGCPDTRFHDLRHTYAVSAIRAGDDIKTVQGNLGHATAAFTLDVYGHVTDQMKKDSADRMQATIMKTISA